MTAYALSPERFHRAWDNGLPHVLEIESGDTVTMGTWDGTDHYYSPASTTADAVRKGPFHGHPLTGPIRVTGAHPGATLAVEVVDVRPAAWGFTAFYDGRGLLPEDFPSAHLQIWDLSDGRRARGIPGVSVPMAPFCGVMGVAPRAPGSHSTMPPRRVGGNMDVKQLTAGATLYLPVEVEGALFSAGDAHAAQGDGEVCITAIEMDSVSTFRFSLLADAGVREPQLATPGPPTAIGGSYHGCTAHAPDLMVATKNATRYLIEWLGTERGLSPEDAYVLCSVAAELRLSQVVAAPIWSVTAFIPLGVFD